MPVFESGGVSLNYEISGDGFPVLLFAPGGMRSAISFWANSPWNPIASFKEDFKVIAMDQRNAGASIAPITASDNWQTYTKDHLALLDHLEVEQCHVMGGCIGGPYCLGLMRAAPTRVKAAVIQQTIGLDGNREAFYDMFDSWAEELKAGRPGVSESDWNSFRSNMYDQEFLFNVDRDFVRNCDIPMLVLMGNDLYHPESVSRELALLAPDAELVENWKDDPGLTAQRAVSFLKGHT
jgi:pimeloyl-ACP methyl ester carboxylesterase